jgi:hypothetical protein
VDAQDSSFWSHFASPYTNPFTAFTSRGIFLLRYQAGCETQPNARHIARIARNSLKFKPLPGNAKLWIQATELGNCCKQKEYWCHPRRNHSHLWRVIQKVQVGIQRSRYNVGGGGVILWREQPLIAETCFLLSRLTVLHGQPISITSLEVIRTGVPCECCYSQYT